MTFKMNGQPSATLWQTVAILAIALSCGEVKLSANAATTAIKAASIIESKIDTVQEHLAAVNAKLDVINGAILNEYDCARQMPIIAEKFRLIEQRLEQLNHKYDELINQNTDNIDKTQKSDLNIDGVPPPPLQTTTENVNNDDDFRNRFSSSTVAASTTKRSETTAKIENHLHLHQLLRPARRNLTSPSQNNNEQEAKNRQRQNRESKRNVNFINELLKMVNARMSSGEEDAAAASSSSMTDIISNVENPKNDGESTKKIAQSQQHQTRRRNKTISTSGSSNSSSRGGGTTKKQQQQRKSGGIVFPNIKNRLAMMNATTSFISSIKRETYGYSCVDLMNAGKRLSDVYYLRIRSTTFWFLKVFCEQEIADGGWLVIQRRGEFGQPRENFNRDWADYKKGFGDPEREFWMGNENLYMLTNNDDYALRIELEDFEGQRRYAQYSSFKIHSEADYYRLEIDGYEGNAGDALSDLDYGANNIPFSTHNRDNDRSSLNCASMLKGGWWWKSCGRGLNGLYLDDPNDIAAKLGIIWFKWHGWDYTLKSAKMMIKPLSKIAVSNIA